MTCLSYTIVGYYLVALRVACCSSSRRYAHSVVFVPMYVEHLALIMPCLPPSPGEPSPSGVPNIGIMLVDVQYVQCRSTGSRMPRLISDGVLTLTFNSGG